MHQKHTFRDLSPVFTISAKRVYDGGGYKQTGGPRVFLNIGEINTMRYIARSPEGDPIPGLDFYIDRRWWDLIEVFEGQTQRSMPDKRPTIFGFTLGMHPSIQPNVENPYVLVVNTANSQAVRISLIEGEENPSRESLISTSTAA